MRIKRKVRSLRVLAKSQHKPNRNALHGGGIRQKDQAFRGGSFSKEEVPNPKLEGKSCLCASS